MSDLKEPFNSLAPIPWADVPLNDLSTFLHENFTQAEILVNSVPLSTDKPSHDKHPDTPASEPNTATKAADTFTTAHLTGVDTRNESLHKLWGKPIKLSAKENPLDVSVFKTAGFDRRGAWFGRRSTHTGLGFSRWRKAMQREFIESLKVQQGPGSGAVRGIAGDKRLEKKTVEGVGRAEVWQLSAAFPGPVTPRGFFSLILTSENALSEASSTIEEPSASNIPRHYMIISRPTTYEDATPNKALVYGTYQSVELIREVPNADNKDPEMNPVEWIMITRSDPGGGIPKFMVERGTPGSIVADVPKFIDWTIKQGDMPELDESTEDEVVEKTMSVQEQDLQTTSTTGEDESHLDKEIDSTNAQPTETPITQTQTTTSTAPHPDEQGYSTLLGNLTSAVGATVSGYLPYLGYNPATSEADLTTSKTTHPADAASIASSSSSSSAGSTSSVNTFASAPELRTQDSRGPPRIDSTLSLDSRKLRNNAADNAKDPPLNSHEKELQKITERRAALDERLAKTREADAQKTQELAGREEEEPAKDAERREKARLKAEERHRREVEKLEERRAKETRKAEDARRKAELKAEERARKSAEKDAVNRARTERDEVRRQLEAATKENEALRLQIEELQRQNNSLVQKLGAQGEQGMEALRKVREEAAAAGSSRSRTSSRASGSRGGGSGGVGAHVSGSGSSQKSKESKDTGNGVAVDQV